MRKAITFAAIVLMTAACNKQSTTTSATAPSSSETAVAQSNMTPEDLGELGAKIKKNPKEADKLLSEKGLNEQSFEQAVRKVAENPDQSKRYAAAYKKAS